MSELLLSINCEVVDSHFVSLSWIGVVGVDLGQVVLKDLPSVVFQFVLDGQPISCLVVLPRFYISLSFMIDMESQACKE